MPIFFRGDLRQEAWIAFRLTQPDEQSRFGLAGITFHHTQVYIRDQFTAGLHRGITGRADGVILHDSVSICGAGSGAAGWQAASSRPG